MGQLNQMKNQNNNLNFKIYQIVSFNKQIFILYLYINIFNLLVWKIIICIQTVYPKENYYILLYVDIYYEYYYLGF